MPEVLGLECPPEISGRTDRDGDRVSFVELVMPYSYRKTQGRLRILQRVCANRGALLCRSSGLESSTVPDGAVGGRQVD